MIIGELSLDGSVKGVHGALPAAFRAKQAGIRGIILPAENAFEAAVVDSVEVVPVRFLSEVVEFFAGRLEVEKVSVDLRGIFGEGIGYPFDLEEIRGQNQAKRALEVAAAGGHNLLMIGPPGSGKTMLAQRLTTILPDLTIEEAIETTKVYSVAGLLDRKSSLVATRPFRAPHHTISDAGLVGGGRTPRPGEISLPTTESSSSTSCPNSKNVLEVLRQPLEEGRVTITRSSVTATFPSRFMLVAAMNPCPCGYYTDHRRACVARRSKSGSTGDASRDPCSTGSTSTSKSRPSATARWLGKVIRRRPPGYGKGSTGPGPSRPGRFAGQRHSLQRPDVGASVESTLPDRRRIAKIDGDGHGKAGPERPCLHEGPQGRPDDRRPCGRRKHPSPSCLRGHPVPQPRPGRCPVRR